MIKKDRLCCPECGSVDLFEFPETDESEFSSASTEISMPAFVAVCADCDLEWYIDS